MPIAYPPYRSRAKKETSPLQESERERERESEKERARERETERERERGWEKHRNGSSMNSIKTAGPGPDGRFQLNQRGAQTALRAELFCQVLLAQGQLAPHTRERERESKKKKERERERRQREKHRKALHAHPLLAQKATPCS